nr:putative reverse transcriptase domain-containing protein [Tanacetum cinerariifolium]
MSDLTSRDLEGEPIKEEHLEEPNEGWMSTKVDESKLSDIPDGSFRMCIDYRELGKIDLYSGFHQMRVHEDEILKTTFKMCYGRYEFTAMPFWVDQCTSDFHGRNESGGAQVAFEVEFRAAEEREVLCESQQGQSGVKRKLFGSFRNKMGNEPILALPKG